MIANELNIFYPIKAEVSDQKNLTSDYRNKLLTLEREMVRYISNILNKSGIRCRKKFCSVI